jgi:hypothetical protein
MCQSRFMGEKVSLPEQKCEVLLTYRQLSIVSYGFLPSFLPSFLLWHWRFNSGSCTCDAAVLPLEPCPFAYFPLALVFFMDKAFHFCPRLVSEYDPPTYASCIPEVIIMYHHTWLVLWDGGLTNSIFPLGVDLEVLFSGSLPSCYVDYRTALLFPFWILSVFA